MSYFCGIKYDKEAIFSIAVGGASLFASVILSLLFVTSLILPLLHFSDFEKISNCQVNQSSINVACRDSWDANCVLTAYVTLQDGDQLVTRVGRFPQTEGIPRIRADQKADELKVYDSVNCWYALDRDSDVVFDDPMPSTYGYIIFGGAGLFAIAAIVLGVFCLCTGIRAGSTTKYSSVDTKSQKEPSMLHEGDTSGIGRNRFIAKVYAILSVQLIITFSIIAIAIIYEPVRTFAQSNWWLLIVGYVFAILLLFPLIFFKDKVPVNFILLFFFTVGFSVAIAITCTFYGVTIVIQAGITTVVIFVSLTIFCFQTKIDFSFLGAGLFMALWGLIAFSFLSWIFPVSGFTQVIYGFAGVVIFSLFILYDTTLLMEKFDESEYIMASVNLYLDIINIFLYLLSLFGGGRR